MSPVSILMRRAIRDAPLPPRSLRARNEVVSRCALFSLPPRYRDSPAPALRNVPATEQINAAANPAERGTSPNRATLRRNLVIEMDSPSR